MSKNPPSGVTARVDCGDGAVMTMPNMFHDWNVCWHLTWGDPEQARFVASSMIESYDYLLSGVISMKEAARRLRLLRAKRRELIDAALSLMNVPLPEQAWIVPAQKAQNFPQGSASE